VTLEGMRCRWMEMKVEPLEVKSKWSEMWKDMPCKSSDRCLKDVVLIRMIVPTRDTKKDTLQCCMLVWISKLSLLSLSCNSR
jgi:hypothetical protein